MHNRLTNQIALHDHAVTYNTYSYDIMAASQVRVNGANRDYPTLFLENIFHKLTTPQEVLEMDYFASTASQNFTG